jgi:EmrB/QacA subfamily drug resistance transporter
MNGDPGPASLASLRDAILKGCEPPPAAAVTRLASYHWLVVGTVCIGAFMGQVDSSITQLLLPQLEVVFDARLDTVSWVAIAYLVTMAAFLPVFGRLADIVGRKLLYTGGFLLFVTGSALCGFATDLAGLIAFRVLQGIGATLLSANSIAIVVAAVEPQQRGRALGVQAAAQATGLCAGPALGGLLLDTLDWRWVFWINVPVGLLGMVIGWLVLPQTRSLPENARFDWKGAIVLLPALTAFMAVINEAHVWGATSSLFLGGAGVAVFLLALFVWFERRAAAPLVDLRFFHNGAFAAGNAAGLMSYAMLFGLFFLMPFLFTRVYQETALAAGLRLTIVPVVLALVAPLSGTMSDRVGPRILMVSGMAICVAALAMFYVSFDGTAGSLPFIMLALAGVGLGQGLFVSPNNNAMMDAVPAPVIGEAGGLINVARACGTSIGIAAASACLSWRLEVLTGTRGHTVIVAADAVAAAGGDVILLLAGFATASGVISLVRSHRPGAPGE